MNDTNLRGRKTMYRGIPMRSRLEADYAADLDRQMYRWEYEPECFANEAGQWLPDFGCTYASGPMAIFDEVKPAEPLKKHLCGSAAYVDHVDAVLGRMMIALDSKPNAYLRLIFWQYGNGPYLTLNYLPHGRLWYANFGVHDMWLIWPGMGQAKRCKPGAS